MNKPVAWLSPDNFFVCPEADYQVSITTDHPKNLGWIPLYTHPVKEPMMVLDGNRVYPAFKELTDEEIVNLYKETEADNGGIREFAKAILRKAQEK